MSTEIHVEHGSYMSRLVTKPTKWHVRPAKTQISLGIRPVWSESSLFAQWVAKDPSFLHADSEDSDQTGQMPRLIWAFAGCTCHLVGFATRRLTCGIVWSVACQILARPSLIGRLLHYWYLQLDIQAPKLPDIYSCQNIQEFNSLLSWRRET